jgi:hypothetical protein
MATIAFDTHKVITILQDRGFTRQQAEALVAAVQEADLSSLAAKDDLKSLELRIYKFMFVAMSAQTALIVGLLQLLK